jgi:endoglucanase
MSMVTAVKSPMLTVKSNQLVNGDGQAVVLRGFGLGGWMNMENFITGYPANEEAQRAAIRNVLGDELYELFFDRFLAYFFSEDDARYISSLGLNLVRVPLNYRHFEDDMHPFVLKEDGFTHLDRAVDACARHHVYTILDLLPAVRTGADPGQLRLAGAPTTMGFSWRIMLALVRRRRERLGR